MRKLETCILFKDEQKPSHAVLDGLLKIKLFSKGAVSQLYSIQQNVNDPSSESFRADW